MLLRLFDFSMVTFGTVFSQFRAQFLIPVVRIREAAHQAITISYRLGKGKFCIHQIRSQANWA